MSDEMVCKHCGEYLECVRVDTKLQADVYGYASIEIISGKPVVNMDEFEIEDYDVTGQDASMAEIEQYACPECEHESLYLEDIVDGGIERVYRSLGRKMIAELVPGDLFRPPDDDRVWYTSHVSAATVMAYTHPRHNQNMSLPKAGWEVEIVEEIDGDVEVGESDLEQEVLIEDFIQM